MVYQVRTVWTAFSGGPYYTNTFFSSDSDVNAITASWRTLLDSSRTAFTSAISAQVQNEVIELNDATGEATAAFVVSGGAPIPGSQTGDPLPTQTQGLIRWTTGAFRDGKRVSGRFYLPGPTTQDSLGGVPVAAYLATWGAALATYLDDVTPGVIEPAVWSRPRAARPAVGDKPAVPARPGASFPVNTASVETQWATLRTRSLRG